MSTIIHLKASHGYKRSTGLKMPDGTIGVLRIGKETWSPTQTWRHWRGWLAEYPSEQAWRDAMDLRPKVAAPTATASAVINAALPARTTTVSGWTNFVRYVVSNSDGQLTYAKALKIASPRWKDLTDEERTRFKDAAYRPSEPLQQPVQQPVTRPVFTQQKVRSGMLPPGDYYIGDLCYAMADEFYHDVWGTKFGYATGLYSDGTRHFAMGGTGGDGTFPGSNGHEYSVDAGIIGITSMSLVTKNFSGCGTVHTFTEPVKFDFDEAECAFHFESGHFYLKIGYNYEDEDY